MKIVVLAVGRLKDRSYAEAAAGYLERAGRFAPCEQQEVRAGGSGDAAAVRAAEGERILAALGEHDTVAVCDERGRQLSTTEFIAWVSKRLGAGGAGRLVFVVGGAEGVSPGVRERADQLLALSRMTLPHELARVVLCEQIYRVLSTLAGHPYHRG